MRFSDRTTGRDLLVVAHQRLTVTWWEQQRAHYDLFTSQVVLLAQARAGDPDAAQRRVAVLERLPLLDVADAAITLAAALVSGQALPGAGVPKMRSITPATSTDYLYPEELEG